MGLLVYKFQFKGAMSTTSRDYFYLDSKIPHCVRSCIGTRLINVQKVFECEYVMDR